MNEMESEFAFRKIQATETAEGIENHRKIHDILCGSQFFLFGALWANYFIKPGANFDLKNDFKNYRVAR